MRTIHRPYSVLDVFTDTRLAGNALAVVHDADGLDEEVMLGFARETRLAETAFVQSATVDGADYRNRIFTVAGEVPFAGHPSLGVAAAVARSRGQEAAEYVQETGAGLQQVTVRLTGEGGHASVLQEPAEWVAALDPKPVLAAVGLEPSAGDPSLQPEIVSTGLPAALVPVRDSAAVSSARPDFDAIHALLAPHDTLNLYLTHWKPQAGRARARMFSRLVQEGEDPATGSAAGPLCAYLARHAGAQRVEVIQGVEIGRPSLLIATVEGDRVRVSGGVVSVIEGTVALPG